MSLRFAALALSTVLLAACQSGPATGPWLMAGDQPWVGPDGKCMQLRPLQDKEKSGFCYDVMTDVYQKKHHYEPLSKDEFAFLYPHVEPTPDSAYNLEPAPPALAEVTSGNPLPPVQPYLEQIYTSLPFRFNNAHLSTKNRNLLRDSFHDWQGKDLRVVSVTVTGHTDHIGSVAYNLQLSKWRAESVAYFLRHLGVAQKDITQNGVGMLRPLPTAQSDADNRYVDLQVWLVSAKVSEPVAMR
jgi:outer membrane protein OmpA-like peptidoglycan-associated protein